MKSRGVYETPGGTILYQAHEMLEDHHPGQGNHSTTSSSWRIKFAELVYNGQWYTPLREALSAFVDSTQETRNRRCKAEAVQGQHHHRHLYTSPYTLYSEDMATFDEDDCYNQADSAGFINLFGLPHQGSCPERPESCASKTGEHFPS